MRTRCTACAPDPSIDNDIAPETHRPHAPPAAGPSAVAAGTPACGVLRVGPGWAVHIRPSLDPAGVWGPTQASTLHSVASETLQCAGWLRGLLCLDRRTTDAAPIGTTMDDEAMARELQREINGMRPTSPRKDNVSTTRKRSKSATRSPSPAAKERAADYLALHRGLMLADMHESDVAWTLLFGWTAECLNTCHVPELVTTTNLNVTMVRCFAQMASLTCCCLQAFAPAS